MDEKAPIGVIVREFISQNIIVVVLVALGLLMCGVGAIQYLSSSNKSSEIEFITSTDKSVKGTSDITSKISVYVAGSVQKEGVYALNEGTRIQDALIAAGGLASNADRDFIEKKLNLAQKLIDGGKIYIPAIGEERTVIANLASNKEGVDTTSDPMVENTDGLININNASEKDLDVLPKIGPVTAQKIIAGRPYGSVEELVSKKILTQKTFDGLKDKITVQ
jgi:competence protein ComEA